VASVGIWTFGFESFDSSWSSSEIRDVDRVFFVLMFSARLFSRLPSCPRRPFADFILDLIDDVSSDSSIEDAFAGVLEADGLDCA
jgi:hypothetical protein